jgi:hypothetical protein
MVSTMNGFKDYEVKCCIKNGNSKNNISGSTQELDEPYFFVPDQEHFFHSASALVSPQKLSFIARTDSGIFNP